VTIEHEGVTLECGSLLPLSPRRACWPSLDEAASKARARKAAASCRTPKRLRPVSPASLCEAMPFFTRSCREAAVVLAVVASLAIPSARAQTIVSVDEGGRRIYVNADDSELYEAVRRGGAAAAKRVVEERKRSLPGIQQYVDKMSRRYDIDSALVNAIIDTESAWNQRARSNKGALGLMQLLPETGQRFGVRDLFDPKQNVTGGIRYLRFLLDRFEGNLRLVLAAYNAGEQAVAARGNVPPFAETRDYVARVAARYREAGAALSGGTRQIYALAEEGRTVFVNY